MRWLLIVLLYMKLREAERIGSANPVRALDMTWSGLRESSNDKDYLKQVSMGLAGLTNNHVAQYPTVLMLSGSRRPLVAECLVMEPLGKHSALFFTVFTLQIVVF